MTISTVRMMSRALQRPSTYTIIVPEAEQAGPGPYHVLLQLHGYGDDHSAWVHKSNIARYAEKVPLIVVFPNGENGYWTNWEPGRLYEDFLMQDLWAHVTATYPVVADPRWAIGGLSMGGFGAIRLGLKYPDRFASIFAHSSFLPNAPELAEWVGRWSGWRADFSAAFQADNNVYGWADRLAPLAATDQLSLPATPCLGFDCGVDDSLLGQNQRFHAHLEQLGLPHSYAEHPGGHTWTYWDAHIRTALRRHCEVFGLPYAETD